MIRVDSTRFFRPPQSSAGAFNNWLAMFLDLDEEVYWDEVEAILERTYRMVAPSDLILALDHRRPHKARLPEQ